MILWWIMIFDCVVLRWPTAKKRLKLQMLLMETGKLRTCSKIHPAEVSIINNSNVFFEVSLDLFVSFLDHAKNEKACPAKGQKV